MLNAIGLANVGLKRFIAGKVPRIRQMACPVVVNVAGHSTDDYVKTAGAVVAHGACIRATSVSVEALAPDITALLPTLRTE
jgi:hypothetical protein